MMVQTSAHALAQVTASLVRAHDVTDLLAAVMRDCIDVLPVDAAAILVEHSGSIELLSASSHRVEELELYQAQVDAGPCVEAIRDGAPVTAVGLAAVAARWPDFAQVMESAGFRSVHALPLSWRGTTLGGLNLFSVGEADLGELEAEVAQNFADLATLAVLRPVHASSAAEVERSIDSALEGRVVVEQAKGVLAYSLGLDMGAAYEELVRRARSEGTDVTRAARDLIENADA